MALIRLCCCSAAVLYSLFTAVHRSLFTDHVRTSVTL